MPGLSSPSPEQVLLFGFLSTKIVKRSVYTNLRFVIQLNGTHGEKKYLIKNVVFDSWQNKIWFLQNTNNDVKCYGNNNKNGKKFKVTYLIISNIPPQYVTAFETGFYLTDKWYLVQ